MEYHFNPIRVETDPFSLENQSEVRGESAKPLIYKNLEVEGPSRTDAVNRNGLFGTDG